MKRAVFAVVFLILWGQFAFTQNKMPVPAGISVSVTGMQAEISWTAGGTESDTYLVYRSREPVSKGNLKSAVLIATVADGKTSYTDTLPDTKEYFYAVLTKDGNTVSDSIIPSANASITGVSGTGTKNNSQTAQITNLSAIVEGETVILTYSSSPKNRNLVMYRSTSPFTDIHSLTGAVIVDTFDDNGSPFIDYPIPEVPYYYGLVDEDIIRAGTVRFLPGQNTTAVPVSVRSDAAGAGLAKKENQIMRPIPLPYLNIPGRSDIPEIPLSAETAAIVKKLTDGVTEEESGPLKPYIFPVDEKSDSGGEEYTLRTILNTTFAEGNWEEAYTELTKFLSIRRTEETTDRANFYLGEVCYFTGRYEDALFNFLLAQDSYYALSQKWIQHVLQKI